MGDTRNVLFTVEDRMVQMGNAPALGDVEAEPLRQFRSSLFGDRVLPGAEG